MDLRRTLSRLPAGMKLAIVLRYYPDLPSVDGLGQVLGSGAIGIAQGGNAPYWGEADGGITFSAPGCCGVQFDGDSWTSIAVIQVQKGPPG